MFKILAGIIFNLQIYKIKKAFEKIRFMIFFKTKNIVKFTDNKEWYNISLTTHDYANLHIVTIAFENKNLNLSIIISSGCEQISILSKKLHNVFFLFPQKIFGQNDFSLFF